MGKKKNKQHNQKPQNHSTQNLHAHIISNTLQNNEQINHPNLLHSATALDSDRGELINSEREGGHVSAEKNLIPQSELIKLQKKYDHLKREYKDSEVNWKARNQVLEQDKIDLNSEINLVKKHLTELSTKYQTLIEETALKDKSKSVKILETFNKMAKKFRETKAKIPFAREKRESQLAAQNLDDDINATILALEACNNEEYADLHKNTVTILHRVQKEFIDAHGKFITEKTAHDAVKVKLAVQSEENARLKSYTNDIRRVIADRWSQDEVIKGLMEGYEKQINSLTKGLKNENSKEWALNHLDEMSANFKVLMQNFQDRLEILLENSNYTQKNNLFNNWLQKLGDFVGKSNGEVAKIERLLLR